MNCSRCGKQGLTTICIMAGEDLCFDCFENKYKRTNNEKEMMILD